MMKELDALMSVDYNGNSMKTIQVQSHHKDVFKHTFKLSLVSGDPDILIWNNGGHRLVSGKLQGDNLQNVTLAYETKSDEIIVAFVALYLDTQPQVKGSNCNQEDFCPDGICLRLPVTRRTGTVVEEKCRTYVFLLTARLLSFFNANFASSVMAEKPMCHHHNAVHQSCTIVLLTTNALLTAGGVTERMIVLMERVILILIIVTSGARFFFS